MMKSFLEKYKKKLLIAFCLAIIILLLCFYILNKENIEIYKIDKNNYELQYDSTWKIKNESENSVELIHKKSKSKLNIILKQLEEDDKYKTVDEIFYNLLYNIEEQNKEYNLIYKENIKLTKNNIDGYKILFENDNMQSAIYFYKQDSKIVVITYEAMYNYFDILLDSVNNIIYNFSLKEEQFDVMTNINLELNKITYSKQDDIVNLLNETKNEKIAASNYLVSYSIPTNFELKKYDTQYGNYSFSGMDIEKSINLSTSILNCNLYEYLDKEHSPNVYDRYNLNLYNEQSEVLDIYETNPLSYIYKNNYLNNNEIVENIVIMYELNNSHIFIIEISSNGVRNSRRTYKKDKNK